MVTLAQVGNAAQTAKDLFDFAKDAKDRSISSLTEFTKDTNVLMRLYIDQGLTEEEIMQPLLSMLNQITVGYILTALRLQELVRSGRTVRQLLKIVATESFVDAVEVIGNEFGLDDEIVSATEAQEVDIVNKDGRFYNGRVFEVNLGTKENNFSVYIYVQLIPYILPTEVVTGFIKMNFHPTWKRRLQAWQAGEIRFWRDLILSMDEIAERGKILKADKDGILRELEDHKSASLAKKIKSTIGISEPRRNASNVIIIAEKTSFSKAATEAGVNIRNFKDRQAFFKASMSTMLVIVDPSYLTVDLYMNGIETAGSYTYNMIKNAGKSASSDAALKDLVTLMAQGMAPRF